MSYSVRTHRRQPTELPVPGIFQARTLKWVAISFSKYFKVRKKQLFLMNWKLPWLSVKILITKGLTFFFQLEANYFIILWWFLPYIHMSRPWMYMCSPSWPSLSPPSPSHPSGSSQCTGPKHLSHVLNLDWWSVSHMIIYVFQCYSLKSSHPCLLPQSPKDVLYICVSFAVSHIGSSFPSF